MPKQRISDLQAGFPGPGRSADAEVADCRDASSILQERFLDGSQMDEGGLLIFTRGAARKVLDQFPHSFGVLEQTSVGQCLCTPFRCYGN